MRTARLKQFMEEVLATLPKPHGEDIIDEVFAAIEKNANWKREYDDLQYNLGKAVLNSWGGFWIAHAEGRTGGEVVSASRSSLIDSYSKLVKAPKSTAKKMKEPEALKVMSDYFFANRETLAAEVRKHRILILELIKAGFPAADAFSKVLEKPSMAR